MHSKKKKKKIEGASRRDVRLGGAGAGGCCLLGGEGGRRKRRAGVRGEEVLRSWRKTHSDSGYLNSPGRSPRCRGCTVLWRSTSEFCHHSLLRACVCVRLQFWVFFACFWGVDVKNGFMCKKYLWQVNEQDMQQRATGQTETCRSCSEDTASVHKEHTAYDTLLVVWCYCHLSRLLCIAVLHRLHADICVCTGENYFIFKNVPRKTVAM